MARRLWCRSVAASCSKRASARSWRRSRSASSSTCCAILRSMPRSTERLTIMSPAHLEQIVIHLREQWHALVKTDNLLGPRFALAGVLNQISVVEALRAVLRDEQRLEVVRLGA